MSYSVRVVSQAEYDDWIAEQRGAQDEGSSS
jgi:heme/copper-type cytochrome/quinol oxidase subunit 2